MKYVISDIHGCFDKFIAMLDLINFKDTDELYILGDIIDRGDNPLEIFEYIVSHPNIHMIKGNHEDMCLRAFMDKDFSLWMYNGGYVTFDALQEKGIGYINQFLNYIKNLPYYTVVDNYFLVHAGLYTAKNEENALSDVIDDLDEHTALWDRSNIDRFQEVTGYDIICGHTPVQTIISKEHNRIVRLNGKTYIDCGAVFKGGQLACFCLDTEEEFYI